MDEIERLMKEATLPWIVHTGRSALGDTGEYDDWIEIRSGGNVIARWYGEEDDGSAAIIVAAVNALPELLAEREEVARLRAALQAIVDNAEIDTDAVLFRAQASGHARAALNQEPST